MNTPEPSSRREYQRQDSTLTLREGLQEYYSYMPDLLPTETMRPEAQRLFIPHDVAHVVFGCDTSIEQEALVDFWTMFGSDVGVRAYLDYLRVPEASQIIKDAGVLTTARATLRALPDIFRVIARSRRMHKKWSWDQHEGELDRPLSAIRTDLGLRIIERHA